MGGLMVLKCFPRVVVLVVLAAVGCLSHESAQKNQDGTTVSVCPQEMCVFLFDRLEEQSVRLHNIETALLRTVSILASVTDQEYSSAVASLKSDPLINSLLTPGDLDPVESFVLHSKPRSDYEETSAIKTNRKKRQSGGLMTPKDRLAEALGWVKRSKAIQINSPVENELNSSETKIGEETVIKKESQYSQSPAFSRSNQETNITSGDIDHNKIRLNKTVDFVSQQKPHFENKLTVKNVSLILSSSSTQRVSNNSTEGPSGTADQTTIQKFIKDAVNDLQGAWKCAVSQLNDINPLESSGILYDPQVTLNPNNSLTVQFELKNCQKYWTAVWIRVSVRSDFINPKRSEKTDTSYIAQIPKQCLMKNGNVFWITLPSSAKIPCIFPLIELLECKVYTVDVIPIYLALQGQASFLEVTVPPQSGENSTDLVSLEQIQLQNSTHKLGLKWSVKSEDCAKLLTSADLRIYEDGSNSVLRTLVIPDECLGDKNSNSFFTKFSSLGDTLCPSVAWIPFDICRKYKLEVKPEYSFSWEGKSSSLELYTQGADPLNCCFVLTNSFGVIQSRSNDGHYYGCSWLISVEHNSTIWLTFSQFSIEYSYYRLKVFDGPYSNSPMLLDSTGYQPPDPIRSRTNKLFITLDPSYNRGNDYGKTFTAHYISVCNKESTQEKPEN